jgi:hypothetical protein
MDAVKIPQKYGHYVFGVLQSGVTCAVASAIAVFKTNDGGFQIVDWLSAWGLSWVMMLPVVFLFAPLLRKAVAKITTSSDA